MPPERLMKSGEIEEALDRAIGGRHTEFLDLARIYRKAMQSSGRYDWEEINTRINARWHDDAVARLKQIVWTNQHL